MTTTSTSTSTSGRGDMRSEAEVRAVLDQYVTAHAARDAGAILATYADDVVRYALAPPLQQGPGTMVGDVQGVRAWLATFDGPVRIEYRDLAVTAEGSVAFAYALTRMTARSAGSSNPFSFWFRSTFGLRRVDGRWRIVHEHASTPFHMDGSFRAATDLQP